jgi:hypothetical protein
MASDARSGGAGVGPGIEYGTTQCNRPDQTGRPPSNVQCPPPNLELTWRLQWRSSPHSEVFDSNSYIYRMWILAAARTRLDARYDKQSIVLPSRILFLLTCLKIIRVRTPKRGGPDSSVGIATPKNWGGRNEAIETSGRLNPLWPQNKRLHSPWTTDRLHTRQDRWIQKELVFTPAKNATKPNPSKIIPLQPTRKENNWETKRMMERATVTLETEWAKWPNPGCLWWW